MDELDTLMDAVKLSTVERNVVPNSNNRLSNPCDHDGDDLWCDDEYLCSNSNETLDVASDLEREWHKRHDQFQTIGYRDGLTAGKEASAQEGFNNGFKQSVLVGYKWGLVRGVTSALSCLPADLKEKLTGTVETKEKIQNLYENVHAVSTKDALKIFNDEILGSESGKQCEDSEGNFNLLGKQCATPSCNQLGRYVEEFELLLESSAIRLHRME